MFSRNATAFISEYYSVTFGGPTQRIEAMTTNVSKISRRKLLRNGALFAGTFVAGGTALSGSAAARRDGRRIGCGFFAFREEVSNADPDVYLFKVNGHQRIVIHIDNASSSQDQVALSLLDTNGDLIGSTFPSPGFRGSVGSELGPGEYPVVVTTPGTATYTLATECERLKGGKQGQE